jgi:hypothetical protein
MGRPLGSFGFACFVEVGSEYNAPFERISVRRILATALVLFFCYSPHALTQSVVKPQQPGPPSYSPSSALSLAPEPEDDRVADGAFRSEYFHLTVPLPAGWQEDLKGPDPSATGYYVLGTLRTQGELKGMAIIDAQDLFFSSSPIQDAMEFSKRKEHQAAFVLQDVIDHSPQPVRLAGHSFVRLDYSGAKYHHAAFSTIVRCHVVTIEITSRFPDVFKQVEANMDRVSLQGIADSASGGGKDPLCVKDYATDATVIYRVDPVMVGPRFTKVPTRFVIDEKGKVKHIHVINALPDQAKSVENALSQWVFKPYLKDGQPIEVETGILFEFPPNRRKQNTTLSSN